MTPAPPRLLAFLAGLLPLICAAQAPAAGSEPVPLTAPTNTEADARLRPFEATDFALAYDVFIGAGQLEPAYRVALQAVRMLPRDRAWRLRLAQVAEWLARTDVAAEQWQALFAMGDRSEATVSSLLRLSPALEHPLASLPAWAWRAKQQPLTENQWNDLFWLFENSSEPARGSVFFETQYRTLGSPPRLEQAALLALNAGDDARALQLYQERARLEPFSIDAVQQAVFILLRQDRIDDALAQMQANAAQVPAEALEFWRLLGQVAWEARDYATAEQAYGRSVSSRSAELGDWSRLIYLSRSRQPKQAAALAMEAWRRYGNLEQLLLAIDIYAELGDLPAQARVYGSLDAGQRERAQADLRFLLGRAQFHKRQNRMQAAWSDLQRASRLAPHDDSVVLSTLWFLIESGWERELAVTLKKHEPRAHRNPAFWPVYAAGRSALGQPRDAVFWYRKALARDRDNPLLLTAYADALEQQGRAGMADRVRRLAWTRLEALRAGRQDLAELQNRPEFMTWIRLWLSQHPGDASLTLMRQLAEELRGARPAGADSSARDDLVLAWLLTREEPESVRRWAWERYLRLGRSQPAWAESQLAQQTADRARMQDLLQRQGSAMPPMSRAGLALGSGQTSLALDATFQAMGRETEAEAAHERFRQLAPRQSHYLETRLQQEQLDLIQRQSLGFGARLVLTPGLHLLLDGTHAAQSSPDADFSTLLPASDRLHSAELRWLAPERETRLALLRREELAITTGLRLQQTGRWMARVNYEFELVQRGPSTLSLPLRAAGYESSLMGALSYSLDRRNYLRAAPRLSRYYTQFDDYLGSGSGLDLEAGHHLSNAYPDWRARVFLQTQSFERNGGVSAQNLQRLPAYLQAAIGAGTTDAAGYFIPQDSSTVGACLSGGDNLGGLSLQADYSRAWRPFADVCLRHNNVLGDGYAAVLGLAGSVLGPDHLSLQWQESNNATPGTASIRTLSVRYRHYF